MNGAELIAQERLRQVEVENWTVAHDCEYVEGLLVRAAIAYTKVLTHAEYYAPPDGNEIPPEWPFDDGWWKPSSDKVRNLVKAGALLAAEIDRLQALL